MITVTVTRLSYNQIAGFRRINILKAIHYYVARSRYSPGANGICLVSVHLSWTYSYF